MILTHLSMINVCYPPTPYSTCYGPYLNLFGPGGFEVEGTGLKSRGLGWEVGLETADVVCRFRVPEVRLAAGFSWRTLN